LSYNIGIEEGSQAVAAELDEKNGYLAYDIMVIDPSSNFSKVLVAMARNWTGNIEQAGILSSLLGVFQRIMPVIFSCIHSNRKTLTFFVK
jgi:hypothetical protein